MRITSQRGTCSLYLNYNEERLMRRPGPHLEGVLQPFCEHEGDEMTKVESLAGWPLHIWAHNSEHAILQSLFT